MKYTTNKRSSKKGFYSALAVSLIAIGSAGWVAVNNIIPPKEESSNVSSSYVSSVSSTVSESEAVQSEPSPAYSLDTTESEQPADSYSSVPADESVVQTAATPVASFYVLPITGTVIKPYDDKNLSYSETMKDWRLHTAVDIEGNLGDKVCASGDGVITEIITNDSLYGTVVVIDHGNGITSTYAGLNEKVNFKVGDTVYANDKIGTLGEIPCECADPIHLHFEMKKDGTPISPLKTMGLID